LGKSFVNDKAPGGNYLSHNVMFLICPILRLTKSFIENVSKEAVELAGSECGLLSGDWAMATKWLNVPESSNFGADGICIFIFIFCLNDRDVFGA
jgi:hypothetical protein